MEKARLISQGECETHIHKQPREGTPDRIIRGFRLSGVAWRFLRELLGFNHERICPALLRRLASLRIESAPGD